MADRLSTDVVARLRARAQDPAGRSDVGGLEASSVSPDEMIDGSLNSDNPAVREYLEGMNTPFAGMISNMVTGDGSQAKGLFGMLGGLLGNKQMFASMGDQTIAFGRKGDPRPAPPPCSEAEVAAAEAGLGFALPPALRQFYLEIANGGVGPGDGLYSLKELRAKRREFTREPIGPRGQKWPAKLLPIHGADWDVICIDRDTGQLIQRDVEEIDYGGWTKSFVPHADSLEAWFDTWLGKPTAAEKAKRRAERPQREPRQLTDEDWQVWGDESPVHREYLKRLDIATMTPAERAAIGLGRTIGRTRCGTASTLPESNFPRRAMPSGAREAGASSPGANREAHRRRPADAPAPLPTPEHERYQATKAPRRRPVTGSGRRSGARCR